MDHLLTSMIALIARPADHHGKKVGVIGYCVLAFEGNGLYVSEWDCRAAITKNALWLEVPPDADREKLSGRVVLVKGTFDAGNLGHLGMYSGCIREVETMQAWGR